MFGFCGKFCSGEEAKTEVRFETIVPKGVYQPAERRIYEKLSDIEEGVKVEKIVKSEYERLAQKYRVSEQKFTDSEFPPGGKSLGSFQPLQGRKIEWKRIGDILANPKLLEFVSPGEIAQTSSGDCYFVSTIAALAQNQSRIRFLFGEVEINPSGLYMIRVNVKGVQKEVLIDDYFPVYSHNNQFVYSRPINSEDIWLMLLEKVWAKINGCYSNIVVGYPHEVLTTFSNAPCFYIKFDTVLNNDLIWDCIKEAKRESYPICCSSKDQISPHVGIMKLATYSVADIFEILLDDVKHKILAIRNPWEQNQYGGRYSSKDITFWSRVGKNHEVNTDQTGVFMIGLDDFLKHFESLDISHIHSYYNYNFEEVVTSPSKAAYFKVEINEPTECYMIVQQERRPKDSQNSSKMSFSRMTLAIGRWSEETECYQYIDSKLENYFPTLPARFLVLEPGKYIVYAKCQWADRLKNSLTFATYSSKKISISRCGKEPRLIPQIMFDHAFRKGKRTQLGDKSWVSLELLYHQGGFAYIFAWVEQGSNKKILLQSNKAQFEQCGLRIKYPKGNHHRLVAKAGQPQIIVCRVIQNTKQIIFPPPVKISQSL